MTVTFLLQIITDTCQLTLTLLAESLNIISRVTKSHANGAIKLCKKPGANQNSPSPWRPFQIKRLQQLAVPRLPGWRLSNHTAITAHSPAAEKAGLELTET